MKGDTAMDDRFDRRELLLHLGDMLEALSCLTKAGRPDAPVAQLAKEHESLQEFEFLRALAPKMTVAEFGTRIASAFFLWPKKLLAFQVDAPLTLPRFPNITIRDTGMGIPPELLPRVFDLFSQSQSARTARRTIASSRMGRCDPCSPLRLQQPTDYFKKTRDWHGFPQKYAPQRCATGGRLRSREHDNRDGGCRLVRLQPAAETNAIDTWHHPVRHDEVGSLDFGDGLGCFPVECGQHPVSLTLQKYPERAQGFRVVVDQENLSSDRTVRCRR
jgi:hypothetical protein